MKKHFVRAILVCAALTLAVSSAGWCAEPAPYVLGITFDLTGISAGAALAQKRGMQFTIDKINAAGGVNGRMLKSVIYDGQSIAVNNVKNAKRLIDVDKATVLTGFTDMNAIFASIPIVTEAKIPFVAGAPCLMSGTAPPSPWVFSVVPDQAMGSVPILVDNLVARGCKNIAHIYVDFIYGQTGDNIFKAVLEKRGMKPAAIEKYAMDAVEMDSQVARIKASGADGLIITGGPPDTIKILRTAKNLGFTGKIVSEYGVVSPEFIKLGGKDVEGLVSTSLRTLVAPELPDSDPQKQVALELYNWYTKEFGAISLYCGHSYDQVTVIAEALKKVDPKLDPSKAKDLEMIRGQIRDALEGIKNLVGQNGIFNYSESDHIGLKAGCYIPVVIQDGKWKLYQ